VYLQVLEEIASAWAAVGVGASVHTLTCFGLFHAGSEEQKRRWLPGMLGGELLGAYCLSEAHAGSDPAAMRTRAVRDGDDYVISGAKAWVTHGGVRPAVGGAVQRRPAEEEVTRGARLSFPVALARPFALSGAAAPGLMRFLPMTCSLRDTGPRGPFPERGKPDGRWWPDPGT
jgi:alkylation response protein AidB-like acyl-CoA dehydrogenase